MNVAWAMDVAWESDPCTTPRHIVRTAMFYSLITWFMWNHFCSCYILGVGSPPSAFYFKGRHCELGSISLFQGVILRWEWRFRVYLNVVCAGVVNHWVPVDGHTLFRSLSTEGWSGVCAFVSTCMGEAALLSGFFAHRLGA